MKEKKVPVAILVRVSTNRQESDRQISELTAYAEKNDFQMIEILQETISERADESERSGLHRLEELIAERKIQKVLVHEVSRLARRNSIVHRFVEMLEEANVSFYWHAQGIETLLPSGRRNPAASIMLALLAEMARSEVEILSVRIKSGLEEARIRGRKLGRPTGTILGKKELLSKCRDVVRQLKAGPSVRNTAKITGKGASTVQRVTAALSLKET